MAVVAPSLVKPAIVAAVVRQDSGPHLAHVSRMGIIAGAVSSDQMQQRPHCLKSGLTSIGCCHVDAVSFRHLDDISLHASRRASVIFTTKGDNNTPQRTVWVRPSRERCACALTNAQALAHAHSTERRVRAMTKVDRSGHLIALTNRPEPISLHRRVTCPRQGHERLFRSDEGCRCGSLKEWVLRRDKRRAEAIKPPATDPRSR